MNQIFTAVLGKKSFKVRKFTREGIYLFESIGDAGRQVTFLFCADVNGIALELPVSGYVKATPEGSFVPVEFSGAQSTALRALFDVEENLNTKDVVKSLYKVKTVAPAVTKSVQLVSTAMIAATCLALVELISYFENVQQSTVSAIAAFVATDALVLESNSSGILEYLADNVVVRSGEVYAAVRTRSGRPVFLQSSAVGKIQNAGPQISGRILKGNALAYVSIPLDKLFVKAYVNTATAVKLPDGYRAEIEVGDATTSHSFTSPSIVATDISRDIQYTDQNGIPLFEVRLPLPNSTALAPGQRVAVQFKNHSTDFFSFPIRQVDSVLQNLSTKRDTRS